MVEASGRFSLPWLQPGQAQKELAHNEALATLDIALHPSVETVGATAPPEVPAIGQCWILGTAPTGAWAGHAHSIAGWTEGGWRFVPPVVGMQAWSLADALPARWTGEAWEVGVIGAGAIRIGGVQVVGTRQPKIAGPSGGAVIDVQARSAIVSLISALSAHGLIAP